jgi:hypothetical protein
MKTFLLFGAAALLLTTFSVPVQADKTYSEKDLDGVYVYNLVEIRQEGPTFEIDYCDGYGTVTFNGDGTGSNTGTRKCSVTGYFENETSDFTYEVSPDGVLLITEVGQTSPTRVQLVDKGRMGLIDSTTRDETYIYVQHGVAVEK